MAIVERSTSRDRLPATIAARLREVRRRDSSLRLITGLVDALALFLAALVAAILIDWTFTLFNTTVRTVLTYAACGAGGLGILVLALLPQVKRRSLVDMAAIVDHSVPALEERWQTLAEMRRTADPASVSGSSVMLDRVVAESVAGERFVNPRSIISGRTLRKHQRLLAAAVGAIVLLFLVDLRRTWVLMRRFASPSAPISLTAIADKGDRAVPRGEPIRLEATVSGRPANAATLFLRDAAGEVRTIPLSPSLTDSMKFVYTSHPLEEPFAYRFRAGDGQTAWSEVSLYDRPRVTNMEFRIRPPAYTKLPTVTKSDLPTSIRAVAGSELEIDFTVDQPLARFHLELGKDSSVPLAVNSTDPRRFAFRTRLDKTLRLTPVFVSRHGLSNLRPPSCQIVVYPDRAPEVTIITPAKEISLRPDDEVVIELNARDDFGVMRGELVAYVGERPDPQNTVVLDPESPKPDDKSKGDVANPASATPVSDAPNSEMRSTTAKNDAKTSPSPDAARSAKGEPGARPATDASNKTKNETQSATTASNPSSQPASKTPSKTPPKTIVIPLPLAAQAGAKNVRTKVKLDLRQFQLKHGEQLQYMVRVFDSRNTGSQGQSNGDPASASPTSSTSPSKTQAGAPLASANEKKLQKTGNSLQKQSTSGDSKEGASVAAKGAETQRPNSIKATAASPPTEPGSKSLADANKNAMNSQSSKPTGDRQQPSKSADSTAKDSSSRSAQASASSPQKNQPPEPSQGEMTGAPRPDDAMARRQLDVASQSASSSTMKIHIDEWAGSFKGQQREKLEIAIDPVLKELDATLAKAIDALRPVFVELRKGKIVGDQYQKSLRSADTRIAHGESLVSELVHKTTDTPYAFIGLQLVDITELHVSPARVDLKAAKPEASDKELHVHQAVFHLTRAREMLAELTRTYERVKRDVKLAEEMQRIKKMYQTFVEDAGSLLRSSRPSLNPRDRKIAELELDEEFLKKYEELQKRWEKILAEVAKALAKDPRLLARYMSMSRRSADTLRDQLTILNNRQQELAVPVARLDARSAPSPTDDNTKIDPVPKADPAKTKNNEIEELFLPEPNKPAVSKTAAGSDLVRLSLNRDLAEIASGAVAVQEDLGVWLPRGLKPDDARIAPLNAQAARVSVKATQAAAAITTPKGRSTVAKDVQELTGQLKDFESALVKLAENDDAELAGHVNRRLARVRKLQLLAAAWTQKNVHVQARQFHRALEMDQHRLSEETLEYTGKLDRIQAQLNGLPEDVVAIADELKDILKYDVLVDQMSAELKLRDRDLPAAQEHQKKALGGLARAEERFDKLIDRVIQEQDKIPPEVPDIDNMQLQTLEELLAQLENEADLAEELGIPTRPTNLQTLRDWLMRSGSGGGGGMGGRGQRGQRLAGRAREEALRAVRKAGQVDQGRLPANANRWNTLASRLEDAVRQGRGNTPPRQYRQAIERYFERISGARSSAESANPPAKKEGAPSR